MCGFMTQPSGHPAVSRFLPIAILSLGCVGVPAHAPRANESLPQDDSRIQSLLHGELTERLHAMRELAEVGRPAVPTLAKLLESSNVDDAQGAWIAETLGDMGTTAEPAGAALAARLARGGECSATTSWALAQLGSAGVPWLIQALASGRSKGRVWAANALGNTSPAAVAAIPALGTALQDDVAEVRAESALTLASIGAPARDQLPRVLSLLDDGDENVRMAALQACGAIENGEGVVVGRLAKSLRDDSSTTVRARAAKILGGMGTSARAAEAALRDALQDDDEVRDAAKTALDRIASDRDSKSS